VPRSFGQRDTRDEQVARASAAAVAVAVAVAVGEGRRHAGQAPYGKPDLLMIKIREWFQL
jgi:hypothetical protein